MKVIIQVPCFNEEETLPVTLAALPRRLPGVDQVEWLVIDDGSTDRTAAIALAWGVDHVLVLPRHTGLAAAFKAGLEACLQHGADVIVNTDADNQYCASDMEKILSPLLAGRVDLVVGARPLRTIVHFSLTKRWLQIVGSWVVCRFSGVDIPDTRSGFRALSRELAGRLEIFSRYTYTLETLIQAGHEGYRVESVPIRTNPDLRPSRLIRNIPTDLWRSGITILSAYFRYNPLVAFTALGVFLAVASLFLGNTAAAPVLLAGMAGLGYLSHLLERNRRLLRGLRPPLPRVETVKVAEPRFRLISQT